MDEPVNWVIDHPEPCKCEQCLYYARVDDVRATDREMEIAFSFPQVGGLTGY
jgi:hypothetical protein